MKTLSDRFQYYSGILCATGLNVDINDLVHISALLEAEEQALLLKLPCKVGDKVYVIAPNYNKCLDIYECDDYDSEEYLISWCEKNCQHGYGGIGVVETIVNGFKTWESIAWLQTEIGDKQLKEIGRTVFLTKAEAEKALEEMEGVTRSNDGVEKEMQDGEV